MARIAVELLAELDHLLERRLSFRRVLVDGSLECRLYITCQNHLFTHLFDTPIAELRGENIDQRGSEAHRLGHVSEGRARTIGDDVRHHGGVLSGVAILYVLDDLVAPP